MIRSNQLGRPSPRELSRKLQSAKELVALGRWSPAHPAKLQVNFDELEGLGIEVALPEEQAAIFEAVLREIRPGDYVGQRPPEKSYEPGAWEQELFPFRWQSTCCGNCAMYFKFSIARAGENEKWLFVFSLHPSRVALGAAGG